MGCPGNAHIGPGECRKTTTAPGLDRQGRTRRPISVFRAKLKKQLGVVPAFDRQKFNAFHRLEKLLKPEAVRRESGETLFETLVRLYGWHTNDELERTLHSLESGEPR